MCVAIATPEKEGNIKGTSSPVGKLKEVLKVGPSRRATSPNTSPEREVDRSPGNGVSTGGGLGGLFGRGKGDDRSRRSSISSRRASKAVGLSEEQIPPVPPIVIDGKPIERPSTAKARLPSQKLDTAPKTPPGTAIAPVTTVTPPTPVDGPPPSERPPSPPKQVSQAQTGASSPDGDTPNQSIVTSPSGNMISHRRARSSSAAHTPSKLSNAVSAPLTPTIEEAKTPTLGQGPPGSAGFFSSVFSAAQNAASTLSSSIANTSLAPGQGKSKGGAPTVGDKEKDIIVEETVPSESVEAESGRGLEDPGDKLQKRPAVETIGQGELSLSHLGISVDPSPNEATSPMGSRASPAGSTKGASIEDENGPAYQKMPSGSLGAFGSPYEGAPNDPSRSNTGAGGNGAAPAHQVHTVGKNEERAGAGIVDDSALTNQPRATHESSFAGEQTPPRTSQWDEPESPPTHRKDSIHGASRRKRGSSATTIGAAIIASHAAVAHPSATGSVPRLTGFAVASKKRNRDFHQLFRSVPEDDYLIEDYGCALQKDILLQGRLYVSEGHICFHSNIFGWVTTLVISFDEVMSVEKKSTAMVFPNAIVIQTLHAKNVFASFMSRDSTYDLLVGIWKISHPSLQSSVNGVVKLGEASGGDTTTKQEDSGSDDGTDEDYDGDEVYDEDEDGEEGMGSFTEANEESIAGSVEGDGSTQAVSRKPAIAPTVGGGAVNSAETAEDGKTDKNTAGNTVPAQEFPGPPTHAPTSITDPDAFYDKIIRDEIIPAPLGKIYSLLFGPASGDWMTKFLSEDQKILDLQFDDKKALSNDKRTRSYSYTKILGGSIGPKQTKCNLTENLEAFDLEKAVIVNISIQTPDVPSGNVFTVKTKYCLSWAENNATRLVISAVIEWTGKSWLKGPIEKGASDGQTSYSQALFTALRATASGKARTAPVGSKALGKTKGKRGRKGTGESAKASGRIHLGGDGADDSRAANKQEDWGLFEPLRGPFGPVFDILKPIMTGNIALGIVVVLVVAMWIRQSRLTSTTLGPAGFSKLDTPERIAAYEEIWRREESELWDWLEDRVGLDNLPFSAAGEVPINRVKERSRERDIEESLKDEKMGEREIEDAIRVTQERLDGLKRVVEKRKKERNRAGESPPP
ncbi:hypothetical protein GP486_001911 [Trichoglossum hirsutum]|uniref:VASt domain-containing protein n=1 Tax=Trichoglossum hirsutum TaxID=265104 RepID=A0A9P8LG41_9PEZI|nr:hypothetical protein GP486_001911 [Trichoglossum hirsutum]